MLTGVPEVDAFLKQMRDAKGDEGLDGLDDEEIGNKTDRADQYNSVIGQLSHELDNNNRDEIAWFTPPVLRLLLMAGENAISYHWCEYLDTSVAPEDDQIHSSLRWAIEKELAKPLPLKEKKSRRKDEQDMNEPLAKLLKFARTLHVSNAKDKREWSMEHH